MTDCFSEFVYSMYADGELRAPELLRVRQHLAQCAQCRRLVAALEAENRVLAEALRWAEEPAVARQRVGRSLLLTVGSALVVALGLDRVIATVEQLAPGATSWMSQFSVGWLQDFFFNSAFDLFREGPAMLNALVTAVGLLVFGAILFLVLRHFVSRHPVSLAVLATALVALCLPRPASGIERRQADRLTVPENQTVPDTLMAHGNTIEIDGTIDGSLIATGRRVVVRGDVKGDLFAFGQQVEVSGTVEGSVYDWTSNLTVTGTGHVNQDVLVLANDVYISGSVGRDVECFSGSFDTSGTVGRNIHAFTRSVEVAKSAHIGGNLEAHVNKPGDVDVEPGATIGGKTEIATKTKKPNRYATGHFYFWEAIWLAGAFIVGLILYAVAPGLFGAGLDSGGALWKSVWVGFLALVATPIAAIIACVTLVGIPAGAITFVLWLVTLIFVAKVFVGAAVGRGLVHSRSGGAQFVLALLTGLIVVFVAINLPYVGGWLKLLVAIVGFGLEVLGARSLTKRSGITA
jgi:cytoskeletal protein CcmA (bactofilin family)